MSLTTVTAMSLTSITAGIAARCGAPVRLFTLCLALLFTGPAFAALEYDDAKLDAFVEAAIKVETIKTAWLAQAQATTDEEQLRALNEKAQAALVDAVEGTPNMSVDDYNAIVDASKADQGLRQRIEGKLQQKAEEMEEQQKRRPDHAPQPAPEEQAPGEPAPEQPRPKAL